MIGPKKYYTENDYPNNNTKNKIWNNIRNSINVESQIHKNFVDLRSFAFGAVFTVAIFIIAFAAVKLSQGFLDSYKPEDSKLDRTYSRAAADLENMLPGYISTLDKSERTREILKVRLEELQLINDAINHYKMNQSYTDITQIEQQRLLDLYQMKIEAINKIIQLKGDSWL